MVKARLRTLLAMQTDQGAFPSSVQTKAGVIDDETCFITANVALILLDMEPAHASPALFSALQHALSFIESCASNDMPGAFHFYPPNSNSSRLIPHLQEDADDTALAWMALLKAGIKTRTEAHQILPNLFGSIRTKARARGDAHWMRSGIYRTWFDPRTSDNPVDICVNANIAACLALAGISTHVTFGSTADAINAILNKITPTRQSMRLLSPYYASPVELELALARAVKFGVAALTPALNSVKAHGLDAQDIKLGRPADRALYCNAHGTPVWRSAALQLARSLRDPQPIELPVLAPFSTNPPEKANDIFAPISSR